MKGQSIEATAPVRVCDLGGWTDTWFGGPGRIVNIAVGPGVEVTITTHPRGGRGRVLLDLPSFGDRYEMAPGEARVPRHPLIEAAVDAHPPPPGIATELRVSSAIPAGSGCGTSAAVAVATLGALIALEGGEPSPQSVAREAHRLEVEVLGGESGVQDQWSSAIGGLCFIEIDRYPDVRLEQLPPWNGLDDLLTVVYLGRAHDSSAVHQQVIEGGSAERADALGQLRLAAEAGRDAVMAHDVSALGAAMVVNTSAQEALHPGLVGSDARVVIEAAQQSGAIGWKVNGAGGEGGSMTLLSPGKAEKPRIDDSIAALSRTYEVLPVRLSSAGLQVH